jgi:cardiolipin synthase
MIRSGALFPRPSRKLPEPVGVTQVRLVKSGAEFFGLLEDLIRKATHTIHLQTYIFADDETGNRVATLLEEAAARKVNVYVLADGYASQELPDRFVKRLKHAGIYFRFFDPLLKSKYFYFGRRLHHKIFTVDNQVALVGGINISDNYNDTIDEPAWLDWALYAEGDIAASLSEICSRRMKDVPVDLNRVLSSTVHGPAPYSIYILVNDWVRRKKEITALYLDMLRNAQHQITIMSSYFIPGKELKRQLSLASKRGVQIRVVMGQKSDVTISKYAERYMYRWLLRNKIEIYEYLPKIVHSKVALADSQWLTIGSYNVNNISAYASIELNLAMQDKQFVSHVEKRLNRIIELDCVLITEEEYRSRTTLWDKFLQRSAYDIFRLIFFLFTFYFKQRE